LRNSKTGRGGDGGGITQEKNLSRRKVSDDGVIQRRETQSVGAQAQKNTGHFETQLIVQLYRVKAAG